MVLTIPAMMMMKTTMLAMVVYIAAKHRLFHTKAFACDLWVKARKEISMPNPSRRCAGLQEST